jgi:hypothetical protein
MTPGRPAFGYLDPMSRCVNARTRTDAEIRKFLVLFLAQKIEVSLSAGARVDDRGEILREVIGIAPIVLPKCKR